MLPLPFIDRINSDFSGRDSSTILENLELPVPVSARMNPYKILGVVPESLTVKCEVPYSRYGYVLDGRPSFTPDPYFQGGAYYVQEASSMSIEKPVEKELKALTENGISPKVLDLCAAPGGKSTHILTLLHGIGGSLLVSNEPVQSRATILADNVARWGESNTVVTSCDPAEFRNLEDFFDIILIDAPCSGEGMFRKDRRAVEEWSPEQIVHCAARQRRIIADALPALAPGGLLIYSTCTFNSDEDEKNVGWAASEFGMDVLAMQHFFPGREYGEGFFFALLRDRRAACQKKCGKVARTSGLFKGKARFVSEGFRLYQKGALLKAYPESSADAMLYVESRLRAISSGTAAATVIQGRDGHSDLIPHPDIAFSASYLRNSLPETAVSAEEALKYFKCETFAPSGAMEKGYNLFIYNNLPLGFVKNIGNRFNTLWPAARRVRM